VRLARYVLHGDEDGAVGFTRIVNRDDVGVVQGRGGFGFLYEAQPVLGVGVSVGRQDLDGDQTIQVRVTGFVDFAHAALAQLLDDAVVRYGLANHGRHPGSIVQQRREN
jgi:hypothetical protein